MAQTDQIIPCFRDKNCTFDQCVYCSMAKIVCPSCNNKNPEKEDCVYCFSTGEIKPFVITNLPENPRQFTYLTIKERTYLIFEKWFVHNDHFLNNFMLEFNNCVNQYNDTFKTYQELNTKRETHMKIYNGVGINKLYHYSRNIVDIIQKNTIITNVDISLDINKDTIQKVHNLQKIFHADEITKKCAEIYDENLKKYKEITTIIEPILNKLDELKKEYILHVKLKQKNFKKVNLEFKKVTDNILNIISTTPMNHEFIQKIIPFIPEHNNFDIPCYWKEYIYELIANRMNFTFHKKFYVNSTTEIKKPIIPTQSVPTQRVPTQRVPTQSAPPQRIPTQSVPTQSAPPQRIPTQSVPDTLDPAELEEQRAKRQRYIIDDETFDDIYQEFVKELRLKEQQEQQEAQLPTDSLMP
jgi:flagellar hook-associated protein FlgK